MGHDFDFFWRAGQAVLQGFSPYQAYGSVYPPATAYLFTLFGLLPFFPAYIVWTCVGLYLYLRTLKHLSPRPSRFAWLAYPPAIFVLYTGQVDMLFLWLGTFLSQSGWKAALAAAGLTLKPQIGLILLPFFLVRWIARDRQTFLKFIGICLVIHSLPLLGGLDIYSQWIQNMQKESFRILQSPGIFTLTVYGISPLWLLLPSLIVVLWGLRQDESTARASMLFGMPVAMWYDDVLLIETAPWYFLVPVAWASFILAAICQSSVPLAVIPLFVLGFKIFTNRKKSIAQSSHPVYNNKHSGG